MASQMHVVLKTGKPPKAGEDDERTTYDGHVKKGIGTTFRDDHWTRMPHGGKQERLFFALHLSEGYLADVVQEYCEFKAAFVQGEAKKTIDEFLNGIRSRHVENMPDGHDGAVFYLLAKDNRVHNGVSGPVTHRERYA